MRITREQAEKLKPLVNRHQRFANKLVDRLTRLGYTPGDSLFRAALEAQHALQGLAVTLHYLSCGSGARDVGDAGGASGAGGAEDDDHAARQPVAYPKPPGFG